MLYNQDYSFTGYESNEIYYSQFTEELTCHPTLYNPAYPQRAHVPIEIQLFSQQNNISDRVTANNETERRIQGLESPTPTDTQYSSELEAINTEEKSSYTDVKPFRVKIVSNKYEEFLNTYQFLWIQEITRELYLFIDMAEYDILRGQISKLSVKSLKKFFRLN